MVCSHLTFLFQAPKQQPAFSATPPRSVATPSPVVSSNLPEKPAEEDRIEPAKSAYSPVSLPAPKKLKNPFAAMEKQSQQTLSPSSSSSLGGAKKLTWSERQALAKKQAGEEEIRSRSASFVPPAAGPISKPVYKSNAPSFGRATVAQSGPRNFGAVGVAAGVGAAIGATAAFSAQSIPSVPVPTPSSYTSARDAVRDAAWGTEEEAQTAAAEAEPEPEPELEPEPEPEPQYQAVSILFFVKPFAE